MGFRESAITALTEVGLNNLEAMVYLALLRDPGVTGYRVGKILGKPAPNVYTALESLMKKGAVILNYVEKDKRYSPVPVDQFMQSMRTALEQKTVCVEEELKEYDSVPEETGIYMLENEEQLFEKIGKTIEASSSTILLTADTEFIGRLRENLSAAAKRGVKVLVLTFDRELDIEGCQMLRLIPSCGDNAWPGHWIVLDVDGIQHVIAYFEAMDTLTHAIWCNDQYVSFWMHFGMLADFILMTFFHNTDKAESVELLRKELSTLYCSYNHMSPNVKSLYTFFGEKYDPRPCDT
ncbi:MAG: helix-turn-helix domain-containing protein [Candidatus Fermentibacteria bacterium]